MNLFFLTFGVLLVAPAFAIRLIFLIPGRLGWINYLANTFSELFVKKIHWPRTGVEAVMALVGTTLLGFSGLGWVWALGVLALLLGLEVYVSNVERRMLTSSWTRIDSIGLRRATPETTRGLAQAYPTPSTHPELTLNLVGPFVERMPRYRLGTLLVGRRFELRLMIGNHTIVPTQTDVRVRAEAPKELAVEQNVQEMVPRLESGAVREVKRSWTVRASRGWGTIRIIVEWGHFQRVLDVEFEGCIDSGREIARAAITRYAGACRSAFAWRGDMDLYDESTLQSIEGLEMTLSLAARYRMPQTMFLSTRLSLDQVAAQQWSRNYGINRGAARIPQFIEWIRENVDLRYECSYPFTSPKRFVLELGNHGHLHFGTDTSGAVENGWKPKARMGAGVYPWLGQDRSSFGEQRDNALEARRFCEKYFGYTPKSWAMPDRTNDSHTAAAMQAAGCEVLSDSNAKTRHNVLLQPPPHHPPGTFAVELTKRYPGDPQHIYHVAMILFWMHRAHRKGIPVVFMCHQHLRQFDGYACTRFTEYIIRYALSRFNGDLHVNSVYGVGKYWREVLSPTTRRLELANDAASVTLRNKSDMNLWAVPVDIVMTDGSCCTLLADAPAHSETRVSLLGGEAAGSSVPEVEHSA